MDIFPLHGQEPIENRVHQLRIVIEDRKASQKVHQAVTGHAAAPALERGKIIGAKFYFQLVEFVLRDSVLLDFANDRVEFGKRGVTGVLRFVQNLGHHLGWSVVAKDIFDAAINFNGDLSFEDEMAIHAARAAAVQSLIQQNHRAPIRGAAGRNCVADGHGRQGAEFLFHFTTALFRLLGLARVGEWGGRSCGYIGEVFFCEGDAFVGFHVAKNQQDGIVRSVIGLKERLHVRQTGCVKIIEITVKIMSVGPIAKSYGR